MVREPEAATPPTRQDNQDVEAPRSQLQAVTST
jgi:hypothetical protein